MKHLAVTGAAILLVGGFCALTAQEYTIWTVAGGVPPPTPAAAAASSIGEPDGVATDTAGNTYFS